MLINFHMFKHFKCKTVARKPRRKKVNTTTTIARVAGLELPVLDEDYNEDDMAYLRAQRMYEVKVVVNNLEVKYSDGRERILYPGLIEYLHTYDLGRIMALLNYGEENQRKWKIQDCPYPKRERRSRKELKRRNEELKKKKEKELEEMEIKAQELRDKGLCRVKYDPYLVEYQTLNGSYVKIRMDYLDSYPELTLRLVVDQLRDSPLLEEMEAMHEILFAISENARREQERKNKRAADNLANLQRQAEMNSGQ